MADILKIGASGVSTMQKGLQTTSNNITNVNSEGYTRQRLVTYTNTPMLGAGKSIVERLSNEFAQAEMWRDTSDSAYYNKVYEQLYSTDQLLSGSEIVFDMQPKPATTRGTAVDDFPYSFSRGH